MNAQLDRVHRLTTQFRTRLIHVLIFKGLFRKSSNFTPHHGKRVLPIFIHFSKPHFLPFSCFISRHSLSANIFSEIMQPSNEMNESIECLLYTAYMKLSQLLAFLTKIIKHLNKIIFKMFDENEKLQ